MSEAFRQQDIKIFQDLMRKFHDDPRMAEILHNSSVFFLPDDNPELSVNNLERARLMAIPTTVFLSASKSEGSEHYDTFEIKEPPITLES